MALVLYEPQDVTLWKKAVEWDVFGINPSKFEEETETEYYPTDGGFYA